MMRWCSVMVALLVLGVSTPAFAQAPAGTAPGADGEARRLFIEARALMKKGDHELACKKFERSFSLVRGLGVQFNLAGCLAKIGRTATAHRHFLEVADVAERSGQSDRANVARAAAEKLAPRLMRLRIVLESPVSGQRVTVDGTPLEGEPTDVGFAVDPGTHVVRSVAPDRAPWHKEVTTKREGETIDVVIPALVSAEVDPDVSPEEPVDDDEMSAQTLAGITIGAIGVVVLVAAGGAAVAAKSREGDADEFCEERGCQPEGLVIVDEARTRGDIATGLLIAGSVLAVGGLVLVLTSPSSEDEGSDSADSASWAIAPLITLGGSEVESAGVFCIGRF